MIDPTESKLQYSLRAKIGLVVAAITGLAALITAWSTIEQGTCRLIGILCPPSLFALANIRSAEIQVGSVDDFMQVRVNNALVEDATFGQTPPWRSIKERLKKGTNAIHVNIVNGQYGGCGGKLRINGSIIPEFSKRWSIPQHEAQVNATCATEISTLNLE